MIAWLTSLWNGRIGLWLRRFWFIPAIAITAIVGLLLMRRTNTPWLGDLLERWHQAEMQGRYRTWKIDRNLEVQIEVARQRLRTGLDDLGKRQLREQERLAHDPQELLARLRAQLEGLP